MPRVGPTDWRRREIRRIVRTNVEARYVPRRSSRRERMLRFVASFVVARHGGTPHLPVRSPGALPGPRDPATASMQMLVDAATGLFAAAKRTFLDVLYLALDAAASFPLPVGWALATRQVEGVTQMDDASLTCCKALIAASEEHGISVDRRAHRLLEDRNVIRMKRRGGGQNRGSANDREAGRGHLLGAQLVAFHGVERTLTENKFVVAAFSKHDGNTTFYVGPLFTSHATYEEFASKLTGLVRKNHDHIHWDAENPFPGLNKEAVFQAYLEKHGGA